MFARPAESPSKPFDEWQERRYNILSQMEAKYTVHSKIKASGGARAAGGGGHGEGAMGEGLRCW